MEVGRRREDLHRAEGVAYIIRSLTPTERTWLEEAVGDPDTLFVRERMGLLNKLVEMNIVAEVMGRYEYLWVDEPPPERNPELGVGRNVAWQTPYIGKPSGGR